MYGTYCTHRGGSDTGGEGGGGGGGGDPRAGDREGGLKCRVYCSITMYQKENLIPIELCSGVGRRRLVGRRLGGGRGPLSMYKLLLVV